MSDDKKNQQNQDQNQDQNPEKQSQDYPDTPQNRALGSVPKSDDDNVGKGDDKKSQEPDLSQYVPKSDYEKMQTQQETLTKQIEDLKGQLLDEDYLDYLEEKKNKGKQDTTIKSKGDPTNEELKALREQNQQLARSVQDMQAHLELQQVKEANPDFADYQQDVVKILESSSNDLTIAQALSLARDQRARQQRQSEEPKKEEGPKGSEKPTGANPASSTMEPKEFETDKDANKATADYIREKYGLTSDRL